MKKITTILILSFLTINLYAQYNGKPYYGFRLGLTASPTIGWMTPKVGKSEGVSLGFSYGLMGDFNFAENYSFATGLLITTINGKSTEANIPTYEALFLPNSNALREYDLKYKLQYLEIPLAIKLKTAKIRDVRYYGQFGLSNGFKLNADQDAKIAGTTYKDIEIAESTSFYRAGLIIGGGAEFDVAKSTSLVAGLTLNNGISNVVSNNSRKVKNSYIALNFSILF